MANLATIVNNILADSGIDPIDLIVGTGTINYIPKFTSEGSIGNSIMTESGANILISGNIVLNAGNYNNYAPTLTGGGASGLWSINITGNSGTSTQANAAYLVNGTSGGAIQSWDIRSITSYSMTSYRMGFGFTSWDNNNTAPYADYLHLRSYSDASGGNDNLIMFLKSGIGMRIYQQPFNSTTPYTNYVDVLHSSNYTNYAVQTTTQSNWNNYNVIANVIGLLAWKNYGNNHVIFDASKSTSPSGTAISSTDSQSPWAPTYPTLMGWNGTNTYGVRVDSARLADNADTVDGYHATNAAGGLAYYAANGYLYAPAWINVDNGGIFSGTNSAHFRPNPNTYGPWLISGSRNNYSGFEFDSLVNGNVALSISTTSNITGFYNTSYGWQFFWNGGTMYVYKNTYGGGAQATVLDSTNFSTWAAAVNGNTANSFNVFQLSYAATTFNPSAAPRSQMNPMSIKMWNNYFNGTGLGVDYGTVMQYYSLGDHVDTQVYFDAGGGSWYRSSAYGQGWQSWQKYVTENSGTWSISVSGSSAYAPLLSASGSLLTQFGSGRIGYVYGLYYLEAGLFPASDNSNAVITISRHPGDYYSQLGFSSNGEIYYRRFSNTVINTTLPWVTLLTSNNYNLYAPTLTGGGASGTWNISITGTASLETLATVVARGNTTGGSRPITLDNGGGAITTRADAGGWAMGTYYLGSSGTYLAGFGAYGGGNSLTYAWIGVAYDNYWLRINPSSAIFSVAVNAPIYYDSQDSGYYLDPNSTSNLYVVNILNTYVGNAIYFGAGNNYFNWDGARINSNVGIQSQSDMRAPIFYDSNDTTYYVDPNATSNIYKIRIGNGAEVAGLIGMGASFLYGMGVSGAYTAVHAHPSANGVALGSFDGTTFTAKMYVNHDGNAYAVSSFRAPIFYDSADTNYYLDPNSSSVLYSATFNSIVNLQATTWFGGYGPGYGPGMAFENQGSFLRMAFWGLDFYDWNDGIQMTLNNGYVSVNNYLQAGNSLRAPIFYDSNDTNYYLDPNSTSNLYTVNAVNLRASNAVYFGGGNNYFTWNGSAIASDSVVVSNASVRAPIFYDSNDTNYYGDFASTSRFNITRHNAVSDDSYVRLVSPGGGFNVNSGPLSGAIKIKIPTAASYTNVMMSFTVQIYNYSTGTSRTIRCGGYNYFDGSWYNVFAYQIGDNNAGTLTVRFGTDGTGNCVWIGETSTAWDYPNVFITDVQSGHSQPTAMAIGWAVSFVTSFNSVQTSREAYAQMNVGNYSSYALPLTGGTMSGSINMGGNNITNASQLNASYAIFTNDGSSRVMYLRGSGNIIQFQDASANNKWELVGRDGQFYIYKNDGTGSGYIWQVNSSGYQTFYTASEFNGYIYSNQWIQFNNYTGLYSPNNGAHFRPNSGSYGPWLITGSRNGWSGLEFESLSNGNVSLMVSTSSNVSGFHNNSYGWHFKWEGGNLYLSKVNYGGGTLATVLDSSNYTSYTISRSGDTLTNIFYFQSNLGSYCGSLNSPPLQVYSTGGNSAFFSFHRSGNYAVNMGLDADNVLRIGGWSAAADRWVLDMSGNNTIAGNMTAVAFFESSDKRLKKIVDGDYRLDSITSIKPKFYEKNGRLEAGYIAQEVQEIYAHAVQEGAEGYLNLSYGQVHTLKIANLEDSVDEIKKKIKELEEKLNSLY